jgi:hypothetical protein
MRFSFALVRQHETFDKKSFYNYLNLSALSRIYLKILHCSTSRGRGGGMQGGDTLPLSAIKANFRFLQYIPKTKNTIPQREWGQ